MKKTFYTLLAIGWVLCAVIPISSYDLEIVTLKGVMALLWWACLYVGLRLDKNVFSPFTLFGTYPFGLMLYSDYISGKYLPLPDAAGVWVLMLTGVGTFAGMLAMRWRASNAPRRGSESIQEIEYVSWPMLVFFMIPFAMTVLSSGSLSYSSKEDIVELRAQSGISVLGMLLSFYAPIIINAVKKRQKAMLWTMMVLLFVLSLFNMSKGTVINALFALIFAMATYRGDLWNKSWSIRNVLLGILIVVVMVATFRFYGALRSGRFGDEDYENSYEYAIRYHDITPLPKSLQPLYSPYMYMVTPSANVTNLVEKEINNGNGIATFWPVISIFQLKRLFNISFPFIPIRLMPYNTFSLGGVFYFDGGIPAVLLGCFILGFVTYWLYDRARNDRDVMIAAEYFFWGLAMFYSFFSNHFITQGYPLRMLIVLEIYRGLCKLSRGNAERGIMTKKVC